MTQTIQEQIDKLETAIQAQEGLRGTGLYPDAEINAAIQSLQAKKTALQAQLPPASSGAVNLGGGSVGGSINTGTLHVGGDYVGRDKIGGDAVGRDKITVGDITNATVAIGSSTVQRLQHAPALPDEAKAELTQRLQELEKALKQLPATHQTEATEVAQQTEKLLEEATEPKPASPIIEITGERLQKAADNLKAVMPAVAEITGYIIATIARYTTA